MGARPWTDSELDKIKRAFDKKPSWKTNLQLSLDLGGQLKRPVEGIRWQIRQLQMKEKLPTPKPLQVLLLDIETLPLEFRGWRAGKQYVGAKQVIKDWSIVCWSAKWLFEKQAFGQAVTPQEAKDRQDKSILPGMRELLNKADVVITQNGDNFTYQNITPKIKQEIIDDLVKSSFINIVHSLEGQYDLCVISYVEKIPDFYNIWKDFIYKYRDFFSNQIFCVQNVETEYKKTFLLDENQEKKDDRIKY